MSCLVVCALSNLNLHLTQLTLHFLFMASAQVDAAKVEEVTKQAEETTVLSPPQNVVSTPESETVKFDTEVEEPEEILEKEADDDDEVEKWGAWPIVDEAPPPATYVDHEPTGVTHEFTQEEEEGNDDDDDD